MPWIKGGKGGGNTPSGGAFVQQAVLGPLVSPQAAFDFTSIPVGGNLYIIANLIDSNPSGFCLMTFNGIGGAGYQYIETIANGATVTSNKTSNTSRFSMSVAGSTSAVAGGLEILIPNYTSTFRKVFTAQSFYETGAGSNASFDYIGTLDSLNSAINRVTLTSGATWNVGSYAALYIIT